MDIAISMYPVVPLGGAAFNAMQFSREELLTNIADIRMMNGFGLSTILSEL